MIHAKLTTKLCSLLLVTFLGFQLHAQQTFKATPTSTIGYLEYLPQGYDSNSDKYPIVFFLHGLGEKGPNTTNLDTLKKYISLVTRHGPPKHVKNGTQFPFILISPQLKSGYGNWALPYVMEVINHCKTYLKIDESRIYITGLSLGGGGAWSMAQDYTKLFAAVAPVCGGYNSPSKACNIAADNVPVWAFHGDADPTVSLSKSQTMVNAINACTPTPSPLAKLSIYPGVKHNAWDNAYRPDHTVHNPNVYDWLLSHTNTKNGTNNLPSANAGLDITKSLPATTVTLSGSGTDAQGSLASYTWSQVSGPSLTVLQNASAPSVSVSGLVAGTYVFRLRVTDSNGDTDSDYVKVTIKASNVAPVANAGSDKSITLPTSSVIINGSGTDADGTIASYSWTQVSGSAASLSGANTSTLTASSLTAGAYVFRLTVADDAGATRSDDMTVTVTGNPPVASAGSDRIIKLPATSTTLVGTGTSATDTIVGYQWTQLSGPAVVMTSANTSRLKISALTTGVCMFRLTVTDSKGVKAEDDVKITLDYPPVVIGAPDVSITLPENSVTLQASATDPDGTIRSYSWSKYSGPSSVTLTNRTTPTLLLSGLVQGTYVFKLSVADNYGVQTIDYVTVNVLEAIVTTTTSTSARVAGTEEESANLTSTTETSYTLTSAPLDGCIVIVYNESAQQIYSGLWSAGTYEQVFSQSGLYYYNIFKDGSKVDSGKIYIVK